MRLPPDEPSISTDDLGRVLRPIESAAGLPNAAYTSEAGFVAECDAVVGGTWAALLFADAIPGHPFVMPIDFMGLPLLVTRDRADELRVFHNVCSHRGMKLVAAPRDVAGLITCRYHCWSYAFNGELKATPCIGGAHQNQLAGFDPVRHGLKPVRSALFLGIVFVNLDGAAPAFEDFIAPLVGRVEKLAGPEGCSELAPGTTDSALTLEVHCNWKLAVENYCESHHLAWVHPGLNAYSTLADHYSFITGDGIAGQGSLSYRLSAVVATRLPRFSAWPAEHVGVVECPTLFPNVLLGFQADHAFAILLTPLGVDRTREELRILYVADGAHDEWFAASRAATHAAWRTVFEEDIVVVEGMQAGGLRRASRGVSSRRRWTVLHTTFTSGWRRGSSGQPPNADRAGPRFLRPLERNRGVLDGPQGNCPQRALRDRCHPSGLATIPVALGDR
jgi:choline monooxygenase